MNLYSDYSAAYNSGINKFLRSKKLIKVYVLPAKCARKDFFIVFTENELSQLKMKAVGACSVIGEYEGEKATWQEIQDKLNDPEVQKHDKIVRYINAENKARRLAEKMRESVTAENKEENLDGIQ